MIYTGPRLLVSRLPLRSSLCMFSSTDPIETGANSSSALADHMLLSSEHFHRCPSTIVALFYFFITADCRRTSHTCNSISCSSINEAFW
ncbi:hypothetical protein SCHPADRAFT_371575 [Schizopora paradoxa]|uniref:Uncharacterized protein n=1 Tax=Schizopora paradoxa TaxID=27342 RepID=A0A0H2S8P3_9AGAM|nr:hypothetical protein SCHPADRAFT_371575 [Schizopora paradoxa]